MSKKNTRKRLLAGALSAVMMLTMCPTWALADDDGIATLPLVDESRPVVDFAPAADPIETPDVPSSSEPEVQEPAAETPSAGQDVEESGNNSNDPSSDTPEDNSQNNIADNNTSDANDEPQDAADSNGISTHWGGGNNGPVWSDTVSSIEAQMWITNRHAADKKGNYTITIDSDTENIGADDGVSVTSIATDKFTAYADNEKYTVVFWQARVLSGRNKQTEALDDDKTTAGTEIESIRYDDNKLLYRAKDGTSWEDFSRDDQLVFYYLIRTDYSEMVQIDVSDWTVTDEPDYKDRRSVTYQVYVKNGNADGSDKLADSQKFWYNKTFTVSSVLVRQADANHYTLDSVVLDPDALGDPTKNDNDEYQFSLNLSKADTDNATVKIYVSAKQDVKPHKLTYVLNDGEITTAEGEYTAAGDVYPDKKITTPEAAKDNCKFDGWYTDKECTHPWEGTAMPNEDLTLYAKFTANTPTQPEQPTETKVKAKYFVLLPKRKTPTSNDDQGQANYLPSNVSDGGVKGLNAGTGYEGFLTEAGWNQVKTDNTSITDIENGVDPSYLVKPENLGFFTADNWSGTTYDASKTTTSADQIKSLLDTDEGAFNVKNVEIVWYTIKNQGIKNGERDIHVDGYVKGIPVKVTYHSNDSAISGAAETTDVVRATSGETHTVRGNMFTAPNGYTFGGWYTDANCTEGNEVAVGSDELLMTDLHLYAKWIPNKFAVKYFVKNVPDGKTEQYGETVEYTVGADVTVKAVPTKTGYTFTGWTPAADVANIIKVENGKFTMPAQDVLFNGTFTINKYTVTWKNGDVELGTEDVDYKNKPISTFNPTKASDDKYDYEFSGWKRENGDDMLVNPNDIEVTEDVTYVAVFTPKAREYKVTYKVDGEIYTIDNAEQVFTYHYGESVQLLKNASKDGYTFTGWSSNDVTFYATGTGFKMPAKDVVIEGTFTAVPAAKHRVSYYVDGVYYAPYATEWYETGATVTIKADLAKDSYTFSGWSSNDVTFNDNGTGFTMPDNDVEIHGSFSQNKYSYTINKHFYDEKGAEIADLASTATASGAENALIADLYKADAANQTVNEKNYVYVSAMTKVAPALETLTADVTIDLHYYLDVKGDKNDPDNKGNDTPDAWEYRLTYKVVNGEWNNGGSADIVVYVPFKGKDGKELESVIVPATSIPEVGEKPAEGYVAGAWDKTPVGGDKVVSDTVFTYTYAKKSDSTDPTDPTQPTDPSNPDDSGNSGGSSSGGHSHRRNPTVTIPDEVPTGLNGDDHYAYIVGYPDKTVRPQNGITRAEVATIFFRLLEDETRDANSTKSNSYSDVESGAWYNHAVSTLSAMGIVKGDTKGKFNPNAPITRAEFAAIAARFDENANTSAATFSDIASHWAKDEISAAANNGWITGYTDGTFRPDNNITRAEAMTLVNRVLKRLPETDEDLHEDMITWSDNSDASQWYYIDVQEATNSHYYDVKENQYEKWTDLRDTRDWTELEK